MAYIKQDDEQQGSGLNQVLTQQPQNAQPQQEIQQQEEVPQISTPSQATSTPVPTVKKLPSPQKAGTGTFANLRAYLEAGKGSKIASAASQRLGSLATGAKKGIEQAQTTFGKQVETGSLADRESALSDIQGIIGAARQVTAPAVQAQTQAQAPATSQKSTITTKPVTEKPAILKGQSVKKSTITTKPVTEKPAMLKDQVATQAPVLTQEQINAQNEARADLVGRLTDYKTGPVEPTPNETYLKSVLGDKYQDFQKDMQNLSGRLHTADRIYDPVSGSFGSSSAATDRNAVYAKYGIDVSKLPSYAKLPPSTSKPIVKTSTPTTVATQAAQAASQPTEESTTPTYFTPEQKARFAEVIGAEYKGPQSLQQAGLYDIAARKAKTAQEALKSIQTATGREDFLRNLFGRGREYTSGQSRLDALLLGSSPEAVSSLKKQATEAGDIGTQLQRAENLSRALATGRATELADIQKQAREEFERQRLEELTGTEARIAGAKSQGAELGKYFQDIFKQTGNKPVDLSATEASILGIKSGEGIYNLTGDQLVKLNQLRDERLISKNERARLEALVKLAELDKQKQLQTEFFQKYKDESLAGTQSAMDIINTQAIRDVINAEEQKFIEQANKLITGSGEGSAKYNKGMFRGRGTVTAEAEFSKNLKGLLEKAGYDVTPEKEALLSSPDVLKTIIRSAQTSGAKNEKDILKNALNILNQPGISEVSGMAGQGTTAKSPVEGLGLSDIAGTAGAVEAAQAGGEALAAYAGAAAGGANATALGPYYLLAKLATDADFREKVGATVGAIGGNELGNLTNAAMESFDAAGGLTDMLGDIATLGSVGSFGSDLFGGGKSGARKEAKAKANKEAALDLQKKIEDELEKTGFERRSTILNRQEIEKQISDYNKQQKDIQGKIKGIEANRSKLQKFSQNPEFANLMGRTIQQDYFGPRTEAFPREQQLKNIDNELKSLQEQLKTAPDKARFSLSTGMAPTKSSINAKIKTLKEMQSLVKSDLNAQLDLQKKSLEELAPMIKQQQDYLSRVGGVEKRNVGLLALLKKLDTTNM